MLHGWVVSTDSRYASAGQGPGLPSSADVVGIAGLVTVARDPSRIGHRP